MIDLDFIRYARDSKQQQLKNAKTAREVEDLIFQIKQFTIILEESRKITSPTKVEPDKPDKPDKPPTVGNKVPY